MTGASPRLVRYQDPPEVDRLDDLLGRIGSELERLADGLAEVGLADQAPVSGSDVLSAAKIVAMQSVDKAEQTLRELALVLRRSAESDGTSIEVDLARLAAGLRLAHTAAVVLGGAEVPVSTDGDLDLF